MEFSFSYLPPYILFCFYLMDARTGSACQSGAREDRARQLSSVTHSCSAHALGLLAIITRFFPLVCAFTELPPLPIVGTVVVCNLSSKLEIHKNSLSRFGVKLWNEMPCHIRDGASRHMKKHLSLQLNSRPIRPEFRSALQWTVFRSANTKIFRLNPTLFLVTFEIKL